jgi:hypothetical protein
MVFKRSFYVIPFNQLFNSCRKFEVIHLYIVLLLGVLLKEELRSPVDLPYIEVLSTYLTYLYLRVDQAMEILQTMLFCLLKMPF